ncbi:MAG: YceI family protein [Bacteroidota bacterium]|nr:YceI family protein [Bacteroidota bacterium]
MKYTFLVFALLGYFVVNANELQVLKTSRIDKSKSLITYHMSHPMHDWDGTSKDIDGIVQYDERTKQINKVAIVVKVASFDSKNSNRDSHMMEVTEAIKYPSVTFVSSSIKEEGGAIDITGTITFHGVNKQIHFTGKEMMAGDRKVISGEFVVLLEDFKIERPSMMMMKTDNEMKMTFSVECVLN